MGIIDFLQKYDWNKKMERFTKVYIMGKSGTGEFKFSFPGLFIHL